MSKGLDIFLIRGAPAVGKSTLGDLLRQSMPDGAVVDLSIVAGMINRYQPSRDESGDYLNAQLASYPAITSFLSAGYSPVVVLGILPSNHLKHFNANFCAVNAVKILSFSLHANVNALTQRLQKKLDREKFTNFFTQADTLTRQRSKRKRDAVSLDFSLKLNQHIIETQHETDISIDTSNLDPNEVLQAVYLSAQYQPITRTIGEHN